MTRSIGTGVVVAAAVLLAVAAGGAVVPAAPGESISTWRGRAGAITAAFIRGTGYAAVGAVISDPETGKPRGRLALVDARSGREIWAAEYRNNNCCLTPAIGFLPSARQVVASGDELMLVPLSGSPPRHLELGGRTIDVTAVDGRILVGTLEGDLIVYQADRPRWRAPHPDLMAVAASRDGFAAAASPKGVAIFDLRTRRMIRQVPFSDTRAVDATFAPGPLLVVAQRITSGDLRVLGLDPRTGRLRWAVELGPTTLPILDAAGRMIVVSDFLGRTGAVISSSGVVRQRWTEARGRVFVAGSPQGEIAVAVGREVTVQTPDGKVRWRGSMPGTVLGLRLDGPWLAAIGTIAQNSYAPDRIWFVRTGRFTSAR